MKGLTGRGTAGVMVLFAFALTAEATISAWWDAGGGASTAWSNAANWNTAADGSGGDPATVPTTGDTATFNTSALNAPTTVTTAALTIGGLVFNNTETTFIDGTANAAITLGAGGLVIREGAGAVTIGTTTTGHRLSFTLGAAQTWRNDSGNVFALNANNTIATAVGKGLTVDGAGDISVGSVISGGGGLDKKGAGTLTLSKANTFTGDVLISEGVVIATGGSGFGGVFGQAGSVTIKNGATLNNATGNNGPFGNPGALKAGNVTVEAGGLLTIGSNVTAHIPRALVLSGGELGSRGAPTASFGSWNLEQGVTVNGGTAASVISAKGVTANQAGGTVFNVGSGAASGVDLDVTGSIGHFPSVTDAGLIKTGSGVMRLSGTNTYTGPTTVSVGTLALGANGRIASSTITVASGATFDVSAVAEGFSLDSAQKLCGSGSVQGNVTAASGSGILAGTSGTAGTLTFNNNLTLNGNALEFDLSSSPDSGNDQLLVVGNVACNGTTIVSLHGLSGGVLGEGTYALMTYASAAGTFVLDQTYANATLDVGATRLALVVGAGGAATSKIWVGDGGSNVWDVATSTNWIYSAGGTPVGFANGNAVTFDDSTTSVTVNLEVAVSPASVTVNAAHNYVIQGAGNIGGTASLTKRNSGTLTLSKANTFNGDVLISGGTIIANGGSNFDGVFGQAGAITIQNGATLHNVSGNNGPFGNPGTLKAGNVTVEAGGLLTISNNVTAHIPRVLVLSGGELGSTGNPTSGYGSWNLEQGVTVNGGAATSVISARGVTVNQAGGTVFNVGSGAASGVDLDVTGTIGHYPNIRSSGLIKTGAGVMSLSRANSYTGSTVVSTGTLRLGANNALPPGGAVKLAGGTLDMGAFTNTPSSLMVTNSSTLVLGAGQLSFTNQTAEVWSGGALTLTGELGDTTLRFQPPLTSGWLKCITYKGTSVYSTPEGYILSAPKGTVILFH